MTRCPRPPLGHPQTRCPCAPSPCFGDTSPGGFHPPGPHQRPPGPGTGSAGVHPPSVPQPHCHPRGTWDLHDRDPSRPQHTAKCPVSIWDTLQGVFFPPMGGRAAPRAHPPWLSPSLSHEVLTNAATIHHHSCTGPAAWSGGAVETPSPRPHFPVPPSPATCRGFSTDSPTPLLLRAHASAALPRA